MRACCQEVFPITASDSVGVVELARRLAADLVVIGPEDPLIAGLGDQLRAAGFSVFGPGAAGARLEGSKAYSKQLMLEAGVPTAASGTFRDAERAREFCRALYGEGRQAAVKASGAALGKGVVVCDSLDQAMEAVEMMMVRRELGTAGDEVVVEERLFGREFSLLTVVSDTSFASLPIAQDYKRALDGDEGPNTGGMGAYSPVDWVSSELVADTEEQVVKPLLARLAELGISFRGCLFSGLMGDSSGVKCLEYNVRFGDPECQTVLRRIGSGLGQALLEASQGLPFSLPEVSPRASVTLSIASGGYPGPYVKGKEIYIAALPEGVELFHAGTALVEDALVTAGGRVLSLTAVGSTLSQARELAYEGLKGVSFEGMHVRSDIGSPVL